MPTTTFGVVGGIFWELNHITLYDSQRPVFRYVQKACGKGFSGGKLLFLIKIFIFYQKQQLLANRFFRTYLIIALESV